MNNIKNSKKFSQEKAQTIENIEKVKNLIEKIDVDVKEVIALHDSIKNLRRQVFKFTGESNDLTKTLTQAKKGAEKCYIEKAILINKTLSNVERELSALYN